ncbi:AEC family transporter [Celerinatantimonas sp. YJH-8]|uniref:AEC family transporter n=1 Tax=Celerinatantimonas sp. YJH-8 TaxID=3228714 RepID=UPI0038C7B944
MYIVLLVLPLFCLALVGWWLTKSGWLLAPGWQQGVTQLTAKILLPCVLFTGIYSHGLPKTHAWGLLLSFYIPLGALFWGSFFFLRQNSARAELSFAGSFSNLVYIGIPVVVHIFGESALQYSFPIIAFHSLVLFSMYFLTDSWGQGEHQDIADALLKTLKNPIVASLIAGLVLNLLQIPLPQVVTDTLSMGARAALPCALLVLGSSLAGISLRKAKRQVLVIVGCKLIVLPLMVMLVSHYLFHLPVGVSSVLVVMASCPVGINAYMVIRSSGRDPEMVSSAILLSCLLSLLAWPFWLWALHQLPGTVLAG